jgi:hypothetical protein
VQKKSADFSCQQSSGYEHMFDTVAHIFPTRRRPMTIDHQPSLSPGDAGDNSVPSTSVLGTGILDRFETALRSPVASMSVHEVRRQMHLVQSVHAVATARLIELNDRMTELANTPGQERAVDPRRELRVHGGLRGREARALEIQTSAASAVPVLGDLLAAGATTAAHLESMGHALVTVGDGRDELLGRTDQIVHRAATMPIDEFDRFVRQLARDAQPDDGLAAFEHQRRSTHVRMWNDRDGMLRLSGAFDPERGAAIAGCLERHVESMFHSGDGDAPLHVAPGIDPNDHRRAIALHALCTRHGHDRHAHDAVTAGDHPAATRPTRAEVVVHIDLDTLRHGLGALSTSRTSGGSELPPETIRRLACDNDIIPVVLRGRSVPIDVGRARRLATVHQRRALEAAYNSCAIDGCDTVFSRCVIHHVTPWEHGGPTDLDNLVPLCNRHHHAVHEGGWRLGLDPATRTVSLTLPGRPVTAEHGHESGGANENGNRNGDEAEHRSGPGPAPP